MRKSILSIAILAGTLCFSGVALADETETAVNRESLRVAQGIVDGGAANSGVLGYAGSERATGGFAGAASEERATPASEKQLFALGDRGLGNN